MIIRTSSGETYDTERDLIPVERHILQKLFLWETLANSIEEFREKKRQALEKGWNNSGPITETTALRAIVAELENRLAQRLSQQAK